MQTKYEIELMDLRGTISSETYQEHINKIIASLDMLSTEATDLERLLLDLREMHSIESFSLKNRLEQVSDTLQNYQVNLGQEYQTASLYSRDFLTESPNTDNIASVDSEYCVAYIPGLKKSKTSIRNNITNEYFLSKKTEFTISPTADNRSIFDNDIAYAFDKNPSTCWQRKHIYPLSSDIEKVECELIIKISPQVSGSKTSNTIQISPFPIGSIEIKSVEHKISGNWKVIKDNINHSFPIKINFPTKEIGEIRIILSQSSWIQQNNQKVFYLGARKIDIDIESYEHSQATVFAPFQIPDDTNQYTISGITPIIGTDNPSLVTTKLYIIEDDESLTLVDGGFPLTTLRKNFLISATLSLPQNNRVSPLLERIDVSYKQTE